ncbi:uncharacterized protein VTP21DRAFT_4912 [Calcarisporiella thermophila]|uniref:uncharacterized protein n=1 Tax=Calcarisporiella thermophila TaxID=911321 RepID=UPI003743BC78
MASQLPTRCHQTLKGHTGPVHAVKYNTNGEYCLTGGQDRTIRLWNPNTASCIKTYSGHGNWVLGISVAPDNARFASCGGDRAVFLWDVATGRSIVRFSGHYQRVNCVGFNRDASVIVSGSDDTTVRIWDCKSRAKFPIQILEEAKDGVTSLQVSDYQIITGSTDGRTRVYDLRFGKVYEDYIGNPITSVRFSGDGNCILVSSTDNTLRLMDKENGQLLNDFRGHKHEKFKIQSCLSYDDAYVFSGSEDGNIYAWDLIEGQMAAQLREHSNVVTALEYHPNENYLLSGSVDGTAKVWAVPNFA